MIADCLYTLFNIYNQFYFVNTLARAVAGIWAMTSIYTLLSLLIMTIVYKAEPVRGQFYGCNPPCSEWQTCVQTVHHDGSRTFHCQGSVDPPVRKLFKFEIM